MYIDKIIDKRSPSLILCLAGWSTSPALFRHLELILRNLRSGGSLRPPGKHRRSREIFVD